MNTKTRCLIALGVCVASVSASLGVLSGAVAATEAVPSVTGIWLGYTPKTAKTPVWTFVLHNKAGSSRVTGTWGEFKVLGILSPATGKAKLVAGVQPGVTVTTDFYVRFTFKSKSTAETNHPTFAGTYNYIDVATGKQHGTTVGTERAVRCTVVTSPTAVAACG